MLRTITIKTSNKNFFYNTILRYIWPNLEQRKYWINGVKGETEIFSKLKLTKGRDNRASANKRDTSSTKHFLPDFNNKSSKKLKSLLALNLS